MGMEILVCVDASHRIAHPYRAHAFRSPMRRSIPARRPRHDEAMCDQRFPNVIARSVSDEAIQSL